MRVALPHSVSLLFAFHREDASYRFEESGIRISLVCSLSLADSASILRKKIFVVGNFSNADGSRSLPPMMRFMTVSLPWIGGNSPQGFFILMISVGFFWVRLMRCSDEVSRIRIRVGIFADTMPLEDLEITRKLMNKPGRILVKRDELCQADL